MVGSRLAVSLVAGRLDGCLGAEPREVVIAVAEGPFADDGDSPRIWAITASIRGQKTRGGTLFGGLSEGLTLLHPQNYQYYTRRHIWDCDT